MLRDTAYYTMNSNRVFEIISTRDDAISRIESQLITYVLNIRLIIGTLLKHRGHRADSLENCKMIMGKSGLSPSLKKYIRGLYAFVCAYA